MSGIAVARHGYGRPTRIIPMVEAGHPIPDAAGLESAASALEHAEGAGARDDLVLVLMSGGASANWIAPAGITFAEKQAVTRALLRSGANIGEINTVRKHLSHIKGGRLARAAASGARRDARGLGRAGRRSGGDRLRPDRARSFDARRRARDRRALQARPARRGRARAQRSRRTKARSPATRRSPAANSISSRGRPTPSARPKRRSAAPATRSSSSASGSKARRARSRPITRGSRANCRPQAAAP